VPVWFSDQALAVTIPKMSERLNPKKDKDNEGIFRVFDVSVRYLIFLFSLCDDQKCLVLLQSCFPGRICGCNNHS